jgi:hypothetical protein
MPWVNSITARDDSSGDEPSGAKAMGLCLEVDREFGGRVVDLKPLVEHQRSYGSLRFRCFASPASTLCLHSVSGFSAP